MRKVFFTGIFVFAICFASIGQIYEYTISAGVNSTIVPDFNNTILIANDGLIIPGLININNSVTKPIFLVTKSKTSARIGYVIQLEIYKKKLKTE